MKSNRSKADSLFKAAEKRSVGGMKKGGKMVKKAKNDANVMNFFICLFWG
jgi:hypothetical protein